MKFRKTITLLLLLLTLSMVLEFQRKFINEFELFELETIEKKDSNPLNIEFEAQLDPLPVFQQLKTRISDTLNTK